MELRHLRCFVVLAEELHFTRAAERLHIDQSPLSRAIRELEDELGTLLFDRDRRGTRLTQAGTVFLQDVRRVFTTLDQARENVKAVSAGYRGSLRIAVSDGAIDPRLSEFLTRCREEEPEIEVRLSEVSFSEQLRGLRSGDFSIGFAHTNSVGSGIVAEAIWHTPIVAALPARHPLLVHKEVPLDELTRFPLIMVAPQMCEGYFRELTKLLHAQVHEPNVIEHATSLDVMLTLVAAGYGIGFSSFARVATCRHPNIVIRPLAVGSAVITTFLLRPDSEHPCFLLERFMARLHPLSDE
ncbi:LysR family transcriptional regulator [Burkholderia multivorans]|uniref:LysR family transcriptional regulator n=1 Tax=Burkholderia multivorans TaxID=87883 RepID=UPI00209E8BA8|nr:LysR substrate-binding domain-containing protein [Burkholderia multivorans]HDR9032943.1 LysR family transcriptional regulator [Burkholderia vietnamiensis]MCO8318141.1 LysR family transcriptional regulator [Burkholderia multivorans]MCO8550475.1 LysR family transcriptional regulator [Burkholderia multivorans]MCO8557883.1 LysR family transcriptional regulator [Burkholderia multivorans]MCO8621455.1 LysR family transcriptional regulator [Burkholderia multivorans]